MRELASREEITVDLETRTVDEVLFERDDITRDCLRNGWDDIALTLEQEDDIAAYEATAG